MIRWHPKYNGYAADEKGNIWSYRRIIPKLLQPYVKDNGIHYTTIWIKGKSFTSTRRRFVWECWNGCEVEPYPQEIVAHKNGNIEDFRPDNLRVVNYKLDIIESKEVPEGFTQHPLNPQMAADEEGNIWSRIRGSWRKRNTLTRFQFRVGSDLVNRSAEEFLQECKAGEPISRKVINRGKRKTEKRRKYKTAAPHAKRMVKKYEDIYHDPKSIDYGYGEISSVTVLEIMQRANMLHQPSAQIADELNIDIDMVRKIRNGNI